MSTCRRSGEEWSSDIVVHFGEIRNEKNIKHVANHCSAKHHEIEDNGECVNRHIPPKNRDDAAHYVGSDHGVHQKTIIDFVFKPNIKGQEQEGSDRDTYCEMECEGLSLWLISLKIGHLEP